MTKKLTPIQKEMLEVLKDTVDFYSKDPSKRAVSDSIWGGSYLKDNGNKCAVGRYLNDNDLRFLKEQDALARSIDEIIDEKILTTKIVKRLPLRFWGDLQILHDTQTYWKEDDISPNGIRKVMSIKNKIRKGSYDV